MEENQISLGDDQYRFHTTRWSVVLLSAQSQAPSFRAALSDFAGAIGIHSLRTWAAADTPLKRLRDLTQGFFLHLLEHKTLGHAGPLKGKFRLFLLCSLQNYFSTEAGEFTA